MFFKLSMSLHVTFTQMGVKENFRVKSVKIYTSQKKLHGYIRGIRDKLEVWFIPNARIIFKKEGKVFLLKRP